MTRTTIDSVFRGVTASITLTGESGDDPFTPDRRWHHRAWSVVLRFEGRELTTPYYTGLAGGEPSARSVLESLTSDRLRAFLGDAFDRFVFETEY
jgi:hypothetical protein